MHPERAWEPYPIPHPMALFPLAAPDLSSFITSWYSSKYPIFLSSGSCSSKSLNPRRGSQEPSTYSWSEAQVTIWGLVQSCRTAPLLVGSDTNSWTPTWCLQITGEVAAMGASHTFGGQRKSLGSRGKEVVFFFASHHWTVQGLRSGAGACRAGRITLLVPAVAKAAT